MRALLFIVLIRYFNFSVSKGDRQFEQRPEMANRHGCGQTDRTVQTERRAGQRQLLTSQDWIPRVDQR